MPTNYFHGKSALVVILGIHGGGAATAKWLNKHGARVTVTDMRTKEELHKSMQLFTKKELGEIRFVLGGQREEDFQGHDMVVLGPGVPRESKFLAAAVAANRELQNDASLFFTYCTNPIIGVTGTRGKSTTTHWIAQLLAGTYGPIVPTGNNPDNAFFRELNRKKGKETPVVAELSSWQLEYLPVSKRAPHIAAITNLYPEHLNRYGGDIHAYAEAKSRIFTHQTADDALILNYNNEWLKYYAGLPRVSQLYVVSTHVLPKQYDGAFVRDGAIWVRRAKTEQRVVAIARFAQKYGVHNLENLLVAVLAVHLHNPRIRITERMILALHAPRFRQEEILATKRVRVINDSCATSPDATIAAIQRFVSEQPFCIICGANKDLDYTALARVIKRHVPSERLILLRGSATDNLIQALTKLRFRVPKAYDTLEDCVRVAKETCTPLKGVQTILFSPSGTSFEMFLHEFDRGEQFTKLVKKYFG